MALTRKPSTISLPADAALATAHRIVTIDDDGRALYAVDAATPYMGVLLNTPAGEDAAAEVAITGSVVKLEAGVAIAERDAIQAVAGGRGSPAAAEDDEIVGYALTPAAASATLFEVVVTAPAQYRT